MNRRAICRCCGERMAAPGVSPEGHVCEGCANREWGVTGPGPDVCTPEPGTGPGSGTRGSSSHQWAVLLLLVAGPVLGVVRFQWRANPEPDLAGYRLHHGPGAGQPTNAIDVGNVTAYALEAQARQWFALSALNTNGAESELTAWLYYAGGPRVWLERSTNLLDWEGLACFEAGGGPMEFFRVRME
jgi:hypothetical protein